MNFHAGVRVQRGILVSAAWCHCCAPHRPPHTRSRPQWTDDITEKSLALVSFLNAVYKHELHLVEWIAREMENTQKLS